MQIFLRLLAKAAVLIGLISSSITFVFAENQTGAALPPIFVEADRFEVDLAAEKAIWRGNVEATQGNYTFRAASLVVHMDQLENGDGNKTNGSDQKQDKPAFELIAEVVSYDLDQGQIVGRGNSELRRGVEMIRADQITYSVAERLAVAKPTANGRVQVQFVSNPTQPLFPTAGALSATSGGD